MALPSRFRPTEFFDQWSEALTRTPKAEPNVPLAQLELSDGCIIASGWNSVCENLVLI